MISIKDVIQQRAIDFFLETDEFGEPLPLPIGLQEEDSEEKIYA